MKEYIYKKHTRLLFFSIIMPSRDSIMYSLKSKLLKVIRKLIMILPTSGRLVPYRITGCVPGVSVSMRI